MFKLRFSLLTLLVLVLSACVAPPAEAETPMPSGTPSPFIPQGTRTPTPSPTLEPSPTVTPEESCPKIEAGYPRYARLMHDIHWMPWVSRIANPDWPRGFSLDWYPETVPLWKNPRSGDGSVIYSIEWLEFLRDLQPNDEAAIWITRIAAGLFNRGNPEIPIFDLPDLDELPRAEGISSGGNVVKVLGFHNGSYRVEMYPVESPPPDPQEFSYQNFPWLVTKFTSVSVDGAVGNAGGIDVYFPNLANGDCGYWVEGVRVELFPEAPYSAVAEEVLSIRQSADRTARSVGSVGEGRSLNIIDYMPQGSEVWGQTEAGWVLLLYQINGIPIYTTTWTMQTRPPILIP